MSEGKIEEATGEPTGANRDIQGSLSVSRNINAGGDLSAEGSARIGHNLRVEGWLDAPNIKGPNKGMFVSVERLREMYPRPQAGWWALCGLSLPAPLYVADYTSGGIDWVNTGTTAGNPTVACEVYNEAVAALDAATKANATEIGKNRKAIEDIHTEIVSICRIVQKIEDEHNAMKALVEGFDVRLTRAKDLAEKAMPRTITLGQLDTLGTDGTAAAMYALMKDTPHTRFRVVKEAGDTSFTVGVADVYTDDTHCQITMVLKTNYDLGADGTLNTGAHRDDSCNIYFRHFNLSSSLLTSSGTARNTWTKWREYNDDIRSELSQLAQDLAEKAMPRTITLGQLDTLGTDGTAAAMYALMKDTPHTRFRVVKEAGDTSFTVGVADVYTDDTHCQITMVLKTNYDLGADGTLNTGAHRDDSNNIYFRHFNLSSSLLTSSGTPKNTWTKWREYNDDIRSELSQLAQDLERETGRRTSADDVLESSIAEVDDALKAHVKEYNEVYVKIISETAVKANKNTADIVKLKEADTAEAEARVAGDNAVRKDLYARIDQISTSVSGSVSSSAKELGRLEVWPFKTVIPTNLDIMNFPEVAINKYELTEGDIVWSERYGGFACWNGNAFTGTWDDGDYHGAGDNSGGNTDLESKQKFTESEYYGEPQPSAATPVWRRPARKSLYQMTSDHSLWLWDGTDLRKVADQAAMEGLKNRLETLIGKGDVSSVIDTFNEIEAFLQGITNTETLTGLLQDLKAEVLDEVSEDFQPKGNYLTGITKALVEGVLTGVITSHKHYDLITEQLHNEDLNDLTTPGRAYFGWTGNTCLNAPIEGIPFGLEVKKVSYENVMQVWMNGFGSRDVRFRFNCAGIWSDWSKISNEEGVMNKLNQYVEKTVHDDAVDEIKDYVGMTGRPPQQFIDEFITATNIESVNIYYTGGNFITKASVIAEPAVYNEDTGYFEWNGLTDITYQDAKDILKEQLLLMAEADIKFFPRKARSLNVYAHNAYGQLNTIYMNFEGDEKIEVIRLVNNSYQPSIYPLFSGNFLNGCTNLHTIIGELSFVSASSFQNQMPTFCTPKLREVRFKGCEGRFQNCPELSRASVEYFINNNSSNLIVHADVYAKLTGDTSNQAASKLTQSELQAWMSLAAAAAQKGMTIATS